MLINTPEVKNHKKMLSQRPDSSLCVKKPKFFKEHSLSKGVYMI